MLDSPIYFLSLAPHHPPLWTNNPYWLACDFISVFFTPITAPKVQQALKSCVDWIRGFKISKKSITESERISSKLNTKNIEYQTVKETTCQTVEESPNAQKICRCD